MGKEGLYTEEVDGRPVSSHGGVVSRDSQFDPVSREFGAIEVDPSTVFAAPGAYQTEAERAAQAELRSRQDFTLALGEQGEKDTKKRDLSGLYNAMMRGGLELASGKSIGESGIAGLESATTQARYDREQTREEAAQAFREKYGESQIRYQDARSKDLARDNAFFRTQAIESLSDNVAFTMLKPGTDEYEQMIQNEVSRLRNGSASQINTEAFSPTF